MPPPLLDRKQTKNRTNFDSFLMFVSKKIVRVPKVKSWVSRVEFESEVKHARKKFELGRDGRR